MRRAQREQETSLDARGLGPTLRRVYAGPSAGGRLSSQEWHRERPLSPPDRPKPRAT